jgi:hypothetical protein
LVFHTDDSTRVFSIDPTVFRGAELPIAAILGALNELANEGWSVVHTSEDRGIDDSASRSFVVRQRFLLRRR